MNKPNSIKKLNERLKNLSKERASELKGNNTGFIEKFRPTINEESIDAKEQNNRLLTWFETRHKGKLERVMHENEMLRMRVRELEMELSNKTTEN